MNRFITIFCFTALLFSCSKTSNTSTAGTDFFLPVTVNVRILMSDPHYGALSMMQGWIYEPGVGNQGRGIIIYHTINDVYVAFDRTCPVNPTQDCAFVSMDSTNTFLRCSQYPNSGKNCTTGGFCNSKFSPDNGFPFYGSAKVPLKQYNVRTDGTYIYVTNTP
jgi:hypothetical protein